LNLFLEIPYKAAVIVQENIDNGSIEKNEANLKLLLGSWTAAREFDEAIKVIDILAPMTNQGNLYIQKAMLLNEKGDWEGVRTAAEQALETGTIDKPGDIYILLGMAYTELEEYEQAIDSFKKVLEVGAERNKKNAEAWIEYVSDRLGS
jgi:tetratricopeptide (TPR) repeat protein